MRVPGGGRTAADTIVERRCSRKVRAPQSRLAGNARPPRGEDQRHSDDARASGSETGKLEPEQDRIGGRNRGRKVARMLLAQPSGRSHRGVGQPAPQMDGRPCGPMRIGVRDRTRLTGRAPGISPRLPATRNAPCTRCRWVVPRPWSPAGAGTPRRRAGRSRSPSASRHWRRWPPSAPSSGESDPVEGSASAPLPRSVRVPRVLPSWSCEIGPRRAQPCRRPA